MPYTVLVKESVPVPILSNVELTRPASIRQLANEMEGRDQFQTGQGDDKVRVTLALGRDYPSKFPAVALSPNCIKSFLRVGKFTTLNPMTIVYSGNSSTTFNATLDSS